MGKCSDLEDSLEAASLEVNLGKSCQISSFTDLKRILKNKKRSKPKKKKDLLCPLKKDYNQWSKVNSSNQTGTKPNPLKAPKTGPPKVRLKIGQWKLQPLPDGNFLGYLNTLNRFFL